MDYTELNKEDLESLLEELNYLIRNCKYPEMMQIYKERELAIKTLIKKTNWKQWEEEKKQLKNKQSKEN